MRGHCHLAPPETLHWLGLTDNVRRKIDNLRLPDRLLWSCWQYLLPNKSIEIGAPALASTCIQSARLGRRTLLADLHETTAAAIARVGSLAQSFPALRRCLPQCPCGSTYGFHWF